MTTTQLLSRSIAVLSLSAVLPLAAFAQTASVSADTSVTTAGNPVANTSVTTSVTAGARHASSTAAVGAKVTSKSDTAIADRITSLQKLSATVGSAKLISASEKSMLQATISTEVANLQALEAKINADTSAADLKADAQSITKDFRIYMLVIPQGRIVAAADKANTVVSLMQQLAPKLQARISASGSASAQSAYTDMMAKVSDAQTQSNAAVSETASLTPDQGNATVAASNTAALKDAAAKLRTSELDLKAARADITTILGAVKGKGMASTTASANL